MQGKWYPPKNISCLAGVDEVGRGPLAGDGDAAVILPPKHSFRGWPTLRRLLLISVNTV